MRLNRRFFPGSLHGTEIGIWFLRNCTDDAGEDIHLLYFFSTGQIKDLSVSTNMLDRIDEAT